MRGAVSLRKNNCCCWCCCCERREVRWKKRSVRGAEGGFVLYLYRKKEEKRREAGPARPGERDGPRVRVRADGKRPMVCHWWLCHRARGRWAFRGPSAVARRRNGPFLPAHQTGPENAFLLLGACRHTSVLRSLALRLGFRGFRVRMQFGCSVGRAGAGHGGGVTLGALAKSFCEVHFARNTAVTAVPERLRVTNAPPAQGRRGATVYAKEGGHEAVLACIITDGGVARVQPIARRQQPRLPTACVPVSTLESSVGACLSARPSRLAHRLKIRATPCSVCGARAGPDRL